MLKINESIEKSIEIKSLLAIIDSNQFNYRNKIGEFKYNGIRDWFNSITNNTISERSAKKDLNTLNKIKKCRNNKT